MPEIPDMEVFRAALEPRYINKKLESLQIGDGTKPGAAEMQKAVEGATLKRIVREGKELHFHFDNGHWLGMHLMLGGRFVPFEAKGKGKPLFSLTFHDGSGFAVTDRLGWAKIALDPAVPEVPDALSNDFTLEYFKKAADKGKRQKIKTFLQDQKIIRGIGNGYSDEILYVAGTSPYSIMGKIPEEKMEELHTVIQSELIEATKTINELYPGDLTKEERRHMKVHNPDRKTAPNGEPIIIEEIDKRKAYFTAGQKKYI